MIKQVESEQLGSTKIIVFKNLRDGAFILDENDRLMFIKAHTLDMGQKSDQQKIFMRLADDRYTHQFNVVQYGKPLRVWTTKLKHKVKKWLRIKN